MDGLLGADDVTFSPDDIESQEFLTAVRGYDKEAVRRFLKAVADQMRADDVPHDPGRDDDPGEADAIGLVAELRGQLAVATRLVEELRTGARPAPPPESSEGAPAPEWADLLADPPER